MSDPVVEQFKEECGLAEFKELTNSAHTFILAVSLPETDGDAMWVSIVKIRGSKSELTKPF